MSIVISVIVASVLAVIGAIALIMLVGKAGMNIIGRIFGGIANGFKSVKTEKTGS